MISTIKAKIELGLPITRKEVAIVTVLSDDLQLVEQVKQYDNIED